MAITFPLKKKSDWGTKLWKKMDFAIGLVVIVNTIATTESQSVTFNVYWQLLGEWNGRKVSTCDHASNIF